MYPLFSSVGVVPAPGRSVYRPPALRSLALERAYVVNIHDVLNFDLDFGRTENGLNYTYVEKDEQRANVYQHHDGKTERCRLRNIQRKTKDASTYGVYRAAVNLLMCRLDLQNGWVDVHSFGLDRFGRRLVDLFDPITGENLGAWLVHHTSVVRFFETEE